MTTPTTQYTEYVQQGQQAVRQAVDTWTRSLTAAVGQLPTWSAQFDAEAAIDRYFDLNEKVLGAQRDLAKKLVATATATAAGAAAQQHVGSFATGSAYSATA